MLELEFSSWCIYFGDIKSEFLFTDVYFPCPHRKLVYSLCCSGCRRFSGRNQQEVWWSTFPSHFLSRWKIRALTWVKKWSKGNLHTWVIKWNLENPSIQAIQRTANWKHQLSTASIFIHGLEKVWNLFCSSTIDLSLHKVRKMLVIAVFNHYITICVLSIMQPYFRLLSVNHAAAMHFMVNP